MGKFILCLPPDQIKPCDTVLSSHINQLNRWFSEKITLRPKLIYMAGMKHVFPPETGNREGVGGEGEGGWPK